ncbi:hypothetical protein MLD38_016776 [Melastoma candidum]|uniref:Uncharacterized protein n=1 Tax=Melastoma candidum TaxID=119954 RepID=A0ACB9QNI8_9MYRT|nr:hypothetical protein MLD38_016776 [Melastoma candidum]
MFPISFRVVFFCLLSQFAIAADTIGPNQTLQDGGTTLISSGEDYELGFFCPPGSSNRYVGIWFRKVPVQTVFWVANRNNPLTDRSGVLSITVSGNIVLYRNQTGDAIWSSNTSANNPVLQLLNTGNLVVRQDGSDSESFSWQSFDSPSGSLIAGMKQGWSPRSGQEWYLTSWKSPQDPSSGDYTYRLDHNGLPQFVLRRGSVGDKCDTYAQCGPNGLCDTTNPLVCQCPTGFTPRNPKDWASLEYSGGCIENVPRNCSAEDVFKKLSAYAVTKINGCVVWYGSLFDLREVKEGQELFMRYPAATLDTKGKRHKMVVVVLVSTVLALLVFLTTFWCVSRGIFQKHKYFSWTQPERDLGFSLEGGDVELPLFDLATLSEATHDFSLSNKLREGGFGPVYKGKLSTGQDIAVKRLSQESGQGLMEFKNEVILISKLQHRNLVRLLGCCIHGGERMLVYEYMCNLSLDLYIFNPTRGTSLKWKEHFEIIIGIARGLLYLHRDSRLRIIHRDLKAGNILLDGEMNPKISDFGLARSFHGDQTTEKTNRIMGTYGYMAPEYAVKGWFSTKSYVFSFGVLVMEIISSKRNREFYHPDFHDMNLLAHGWILWNEGKPTQLLDPSLQATLKSASELAEVRRCIQVSLLCVQQKVEDRPSMSSVLVMLDTENPMLPRPKQPGYYTGGSPTGEESSSAGGRTCASNDMTISMLQGR